MDELRTLIDSLRVLARQPDAEELGLVKAGALINEHFRGIREAFGEAARTSPASQRAFWVGVQEMIGQRLPE
ncbi:hypothetical protein ABIF21_004162 [Bradyrhizobium elkanii]|uniref:hypothetical protein n=1 Tax=Bradyrhizobium elkanii TaxID=29448 RepID=UPI00101EB674|nr:hypothetical protein [Bradyrhizobium elkanii]NWL42607.1 hypothetical protein [Bradyrhizobium elkanii]RYM30686.1 hypothetical protein EWH13_08995 [Bradyrhizobium elkanii]